MRKEMARLYLCHLENHVLTCKHAMPVTDKELRDYLNFYSSLRQFLGIDKQNELFKYIQYT